MEAFEEMQIQSRVNNLAATVEEHENKIKLFETAVLDVRAIKDALLGTLDKKGLVTTIKEHDEYITDCKKSRIDWIRWVERVAAAAGFAWVVAKLKGGN